MQFCYNIKNSKGADMKVTKFGGSSLASATLRMASLAPARSVGIDHICGQNI